jgi:hypothetical protein
LKKDFVATVGLTGLIICLIAMSSKARAGADEGIKMCEEIIIPSLLPILILVNTILKSRCSKIFEFLFGTICEKALKLPRQSATAIIFGLIGGYPAGAVLTEHLYNQGAIDSHDARRIMQFNFCGGMAFVITAVGTISYKSTKAGLLLYGSSVLSSLIIAIVSSIFAKRKSYSPVIYSSPLPLSDALTESVEQTIKNLLQMSAYIILFSALSNMITFPKLLYPLIEITNGICNNSVNINIEMTAFFITFGGFCIHFQLLGILKQMKVKYFDFLLFRLTGALLSYFIVKLYFLIFPESQDVFSNVSNAVAVPSQVNVGFGIIMILGCAVLVLEIEGQKLKAC